MQMFKVIKETQVHRGNLATPLDRSDGTWNSRGNAFQFSLSMVQPIDGLKAVIKTGRGRGELLLTTTKEGQEGKKEKQL